MASDSNVCGGRKSMEVCESTADVNVSNSFMWTEKIFHVDQKPPPHFLDVVTNDFVRCGLADFHRFSSTTHV